MNHLKACLGDRRVRHGLSAAVAVAFLSIPFFGTQFTAFIFTLGICYGLIALSLSILTGWVGQASLGHAAFAGVGAFTTAKLQEHGWNFLATFVLVILLALAAALIVGLPALRLRGLQLAVATLAFGWTAERAAFRKVAPASSNDVAVHRPDLFGMSFLEDKKYYVFCLAIAAVLTLLAANIRRRTVGRGLFALRESETVFSHVGGNVASYKLLGFCVSAVYAAIGGSLYGGLIGPVNADLFNLQLSLFLLAIAIVGGMRSLVGPYISGIAFAWYPQVFAGIEALQYWTYMIGGVGMVLFVLVLPGGIAGVPARLGDLARWVRLRRTPVAAVNVSSNGHMAGEIDVTDHLEPATQTSKNLQSLVVVRQASSHRMRERQSHAWNPDEPLLEIEDVGITFGQARSGSFGGTVALSEVSFSVRQGAIHGLVGPNGAGKSTMFNCITGICQPQTGSIRYKRTELLGLPPHRRARLGIARTFQNINVLPGVSVLENLLIAEQAHWSGNLLRDALALDANQQQELVRATAEANLEFLGLTHLRDVPALDLPHGTLKLVELARALTAEPEILLLDEPAAGLSMQESAGLGEVLHQLRDELRLTILIVEHDMSLIMGNCDHVTVLDYGHVLASGTPDEMRNNPAVIAAYLGTAHEEVLAG